MPLEILLVLVIGGISGIALLLHVLGLSAPLIFKTEADVNAAWLRAFPDDNFRAAQISADGRSALVESDQGTGLVWSFGADTTARLIHDAEIAAHPDGLTLHLAEFTAPSLTLKLAEADRALWRQKLEAA